MPSGIGDHRHDDRLPGQGHEEQYAFITRQTKDKQSKEDFEFPVEYMFKDVPDKELDDVDDPVAVTLARDGQVGHRAGA